MSNIINQFLKLNKMKRVLLILITTVVFVGTLTVSCGTRLKLSESCSLDKEELFTGQRWKLRLLTSLYKPYRQYKPYVKESVTAFKIEYPSMVEGKKITLSGIVLIPHNIKEPLPILIYCHGTLFSKNDAPSNWESAVQIQAIPAMDGYITFIPDYLGYGSSHNQVPAYFDQQLTAQTIYDILPVGLSYLDNCEIKYKKDLYILGYSQGGHAAVSLLQKIESEKGLTFKLKPKATVAIAAPYMLEKNVRHILLKDSFPTSAYVSYTFMSLNQRQWHREMDEFFRDSSLFLYKRGILMIRSVLIKWH